MSFISLYELNNLVRCTIEGTLHRTYWVCAEISELRESRGHCYMELVEKSERGNGLNAKASAHIWASRWMMLRQHFERTTRQRLSAGMQVLVSVEVTFHELYGYALNILDIDPTFTLGDISRRREEIMQTLRAQGIDRMNKELPLPRLLQRIAIISSPTAAGYGDFCNQLENNKQNLLFHTKLFAATMQGDGVEQSIISALNAIAAEMDDWDAVVIIRGGGATSDLQGFDTLALAENVAQFPLPVITGIGHERDDTVIDLVAHTRVKTPTAAAEFLILHQATELETVNRLAQVAVDASLRMLTWQDNRLQSLTRKLPTLFYNRQAAEDNRLARLLMRAQTSTSSAVAQQQMLIERRWTALQQRALNILTTQGHRIKIAESQLQSADPQRILRLGFSITRVDGKAISSASSLPEGILLETTLADGTVKSVTLPARP